MSYFYVLFIVGQIAASLSFMNPPLVDCHIVETMEEESPIVIAEIFHGKSDCTGIQMFPDGFVTVQVFDLAGVMQDLFILQSPQSTTVLAPNGIDWYLLILNYKGETQQFEVFLNCE